MLNLLDMKAQYSKYGEGSVIMNGRRWLAVLLALCYMQLFALPALGESSSYGGVTVNESEAETEGNDFTFEFSINGISFGDLIDSAADMFIDAIEEGIEEIMDDFSDIFRDVSNEFAGNFDEMNDVIDSLLNDSWELNIPAISLYEDVRRSTYDSALELYKAQISDEAGKDSKIARDAEEGCGNNIIYIYDDGGFAEKIFRATEDGSFGEAEVVFGMKGFTETYAVSAVVFIAPSDEPLAMCNMTDLKEEKQFEAFMDYVSKHAEMSYDEIPEYGDEIVTVIFWDQEAGDEWLAVVAKEIPQMLE